MKTLIIKDLARTEQLDSSAMASVRGGWTMKSQPSYCKPDSPSYSPKFGSIDATQNLSQVQQVFNSTANGSAFLDGVHADNHTSQSGQNNITVH